MAEEGLSQAELETLLSALELDAGPAAERGESSPSIAPQSPRGNSSAPPQKQRDKVAPYDFKRPQRVTKEQIRALQTLHDDFARKYAAALGAMLRSVVEIKLTSVKQLTYGEFVSGLECPTCFNLLRAKPLDDTLMLDISLSILYPMIDRLLGGGGENSPIARRPLTEIELRLVSRITALLLQELRRAWQNLLEVELSVQRVESDPQAAQAVPAGEAVVVIHFELAIHDSRGSMKLCIPCKSVAPITSKILNNSWSGVGRRPDGGETTNRVGDNLEQSVVELVAHLAETKITPADMFNLHVGDIITTETDARSPIALCLEGVTKFRAHPGAFQGHKAIRIEEAVNPPAGR